MIWEVRHGDCLELMRAMPDNSVDSVVTDPPYGLSFMGKRWDYDVPGVEVWAECLRVLKPGGHLLAFAGTRTQHRMAVRIEDAGFEIRDMIAWVYGSGFPKSLDVGKAIDKMAGVERTEIISKSARHGGGVVGNGTSYEVSPEVPMIYAPATEAARQWQGWGTALKPSTEPLTFARKPLDIRGHCVYLAQYLTYQLCQYAASVKNADQDSSSNPSASSEGLSVFALWTAVEQCNTLGDLFALMDTLPSDSGLPSSLSTVLSWLSTLDGLLKHESMFTTEMASSLTTDLKTLNSLLSTNTQSCTIEELTNPSGRGSNAELVACIFNACDASLKSTLARSAHGLAIAKAQEHYLDAGVSPALEPITVARKPLIGTVAENVLTHGTGAINVDGCRVGADGGTKKSQPEKRERVSAYGNGLNGGGCEAIDAGRWPANLIHDGSEEVVGLFPVTTSGKGGQPQSASRGGQSGLVGLNAEGCKIGHNDTGSAARFFYCAKSSRSERNKGLEEFDLRERDTEFMDVAMKMQPNGMRPVVKHPRANVHPTVKPIALMRYLVRLVTPPNGTVLDPFTGSGSTGIAAKLEGFNFIGCEREAEYVEIARARIEAWEPEPEKIEPPTLFDTLE